MLRPGVQPDDVFGCSLSELRYETVKDLVESHVGSEPLLWEAKGADIVLMKRPHVLRKAVSAFANSVDGGFVFIGVENTGSSRDVALKATGALFPDGEAGRWVSTALSTYQLRPRPWFDVQQLAVPGDDGRQIAVIWVPPIEDPPCIADGSVYERVVGASTPVQDPARLAALYQRGQDRHEAARVLAHQAHVQLGSESSTIQVGTPGVYACVCVAPLQPAVGLRQRLFTQRALQAAEERLARVGAANAIAAPQVNVTQSQHSLNATLLRAQGNPLKALVRIGAEGYVAVATKGLGSTQSEALTWTWQLACELYARTALTTDQFHHYFAATTSDSAHVTRLERGPLTFPLPDDDPVRADLQREIERAAGRFAFNPEDEDRA